MPPVCAKTTIISAAPDPVHPQRHEPGAGPLGHPGVGDQVEHRALPVPDRPGRPVGEVRGGAGQVLGAAVEQLPTGGVGLPGRVGPFGSGVGLAAQQRLQTRADGHLEIADAGRLALDGRGDPVPQPADLLLHGPEELTGADELLPPGQHLAPQQGAVGRLHPDGADGFGVRGIDLAAQLVEGGSLLVQRLRDSGCPARDRGDGPVQRLVHDGRPGRPGRRPTGPTRSGSAGSPWSAAGPRRRRRSPARRTEATVRAPAPPSAGRGGRAPRPSRVAGSDPARPQRRRCGRRPRAGSPRARRRRTAPPR